MRPAVRSVAAVTLATILAMLPSLTRAEEQTEEVKEPPHYESPIVSILFLPVTVLLKIAEVVSPNAQRSSGSGEKSE